MRYVINERIFTSHLLIWIRACDQVLMDNIWWPLRKLIVDLLVRLLRGNVNARVRVRVNGSFTRRFLVQLGLHQSFVVRPLLFSIEVEPLLRQIVITQVF